jgi:acetyl-CoA carboxylase beta subunit
MSDIYFDASIDYKCSLCDRYDKEEDFVQCSECHETICESCYPENGINICELCADILKISDDLSSSSLFDLSEFEELKRNVNLQIINEEIIKNTEKRYQRYIHKIKVWEINEVCCLYIKDAIILFLTKIQKNIHDESLIHLMRSIDLEILSLINSIN